MLGMFNVKNLTPADVKAGLDRGKIVLVDVREVGEYDAEHIDGAINVPLSKLETANLPDSKGKTLVMQCQGGVRSAKAVGICRRRGLEVDHHLAGGIGAWKTEGLPTNR